MKTARFLAASALAFWMSACGGPMAGKGPQQGLSGTFSLYSPPLKLIDCAPMTAYDDREACKKENERVIEEPFRGVIRIRNVSTGAIVNQALDENGSYRVVLTPGQYEVCVSGKCSDPLEVRMRSFGTYGQRLPKPAADSSQSLPLIGGIPAAAGAPAADGSSAAETP